MAELRVENPRLTGDYVKLMADAGVTLPVRLHETEVGEIVDAKGREVCVVDVNRERPDDEVVHLCSWIVVAINTCGGFQASRSST